VKTFDKTFALALGGGGARGIAHIALIEALDEMNVRPVAIAGTSIGALIGAAYAAGMPGKAIRRHVLAMAHDRTDVFRRLIAARAGTIASLFALGTGRATLVDGEKLCAQFMPEVVPEDFSALAIPLPSLIRPMVIDGQVLVDGGATNPLPFDQLRGKADIVVAIDISGEPREERLDIPSPWECLVSTVLVMGNAITTEKLKHGAPDIVVRPNVGIFRTLDFFHASSILRAAEPAKAEFVDALAALLAR